LLILLTLNVAAFKRTPQTQSYFDLFNSGELAPDLQLMSAGPSSRSHREDFSKLRLGAKRWSFAGDWE
jgi:hypothetical protein